MIVTINGLYPTTYNFVWMDLSNYYLTLAIDFGRLGGKDDSFQITGLFSFHFLMLSGWTPLLIISSSGS